MICWLASYPRSGNGYLRRLVHNFFGFPSASKYNPDKDSATSGGFRLRTHSPISELANSAQLFFLKTHDLREDDGSPAIYVIRDGRDCLVSYAWKVLGKRQPTLKPSFQAFRTTLYQLMTDQRSPFGIWSENVGAWLARPRTEVLRFEEFITAPEQLIDAAGRLQLGLSPSRGAAVPSFATLQQQSPATFRRGKVGSWRDEFPADLLDHYWALHGPMMSRLGYDRHSSKVAA